MCRAACIYYVMYLTSFIHSRSRLDNSVDQRKDSQKEGNEIDVLSPPRHDTTQYRYIRIHVFIPRPWQNTIIGVYLFRIDNNVPIVVPVISGQLRV